MVNTIINYIPKVRIVDDGIRMASVVDEFEDLPVECIYSGFVGGWLACFGLLVCKTVLSIENRFLSL